MGSKVSRLKASNHGKGMKLQKPWKRHVSSSSSPCRRSKVTYFQTEGQWNACFKASTQTDDLVVIHFCAGWSGSCKLLQPKLKVLAAKYIDVEFVKIDVDALSDVAVKFGVEALPAIVFVKRGRELDRVVGVEDELENKIQKYRLPYH